MQATCWLKRQQQQQQVLAWSWRRGTFVVAARCLRTAAHRLVTYGAAITASSCHYSAGSWCALGHHMDTMGASVRHCRALRLLFKA